MREEHTREYLEQLNEHLVSVIQNTLELMERKAVGMISTDMMVSGVIAELRNINDKDVEESLKPWIDSFEAEALRNSIDEKD